MLARFPLEGDHGKGGRRTNHARQSATLGKNYFSLFLIFRVLNLERFFFFSFSDGSLSLARCVASQMVESFFFLSAFICVASPLQHPLAVYISLPFVNLAPEVSRSGRESNYVFRTRFFRFLFPLDLIHFPQHINTHILQPSQQPLTDDDKNRNPEYLVRPSLVASRIAVALSGNP